MHKAHRVALPLVCSKAPGETTENQLLIACSLRKLMKEKGQQLGEEELEMIFSSSLECLNNLQSPANEELGKVMEVAIRIHPNNRKLIRRLEETALELGKPSQPIISKVTSGRLISMLAVYLGRTIKGEMIDIVKRVLSDN